jgi:co-chaperonin GroES (HSP10)
MKDRETRYQASVDKGVVIAVGPTAWKDFGSEPWAKVNDVVIFAKNAGKSVEDPSNKDIPYVLLNDEDIVATLKEET